MGNPSKLAIVVVLGFVGWAALSSGGSRLLIPGASKPDSYELTVLGYAGMLAAKEACGLPSDFIAALEETLDEIEKIDGSMLRVAANSKNFVSSKLDTDPTFKASFCIEISKNMLGLRKELGLG